MKREAKIARRRGACLADALRVLALLRSGRWQVEALAGELGCHRRTVYRILGAVQAAGIALDAQREGRETYYRVRRNVLRSALRL